MADSERVIADAHDWERRLYHELCQLPGLRFSTLEIHRLPGGVCVQGVAEVSHAADPRPEVAEVVRSICGPVDVLDHVVIHSPEIAFAVEPVVAEPIETVG